MDTNRLFDAVCTERKGHYCHAFEVEHVYELESIAEGVIDAYGHDYTEAEIIGFLSTAAVYYTGTDDAAEAAVYDFSFDDFIRGTL